MYQKAIIKTLGVCCLFLGLQGKPAEVLAQAAPPPDGEPLCRSGEAGPFSTVALLGKREGVSSADFYAYWRDIHGMLATRIPGFWAYRQYHLNGELTELRQLPEAYDKTVEPLAGFADVSFCSAEAIAGLASSSQAELIKHDEQNVFSFSYLYGALPGDSITLRSAAPLATLAAEGSGDSVVVLLAAGADEDSSEFRASLDNALAELVVQCDDGLQRLRVNYFQPYDANAWQAPNVNHQPAQLMDASLELQFSDRAHTLQCLQRQSILGNDGQRVQLAYAVAQRYAMVVDGKISLMGLRGGPAMALIKRIGADNQLSDPVLKAVYGDSVR
jgi:hypothetical protein